MADFSKIQLNGTTYNVKDAAVRYNTTEITVGTGKQYTSLRTALEYAAANATESNHFLVKFYGSGTYDVLNDISASEMQSGSTYNGLSVPAHTKLLGMGPRSNNVISLTLPTSVPETVAILISTLNLYEDAELENLEVIGSNCRYAIHDDFNTPDPSWDEKVISNCKVISNNTLNHRAYGAGYRSGMRWKFVDCEFINTEAQTAGNAAFTAHNNSPMNKPSYLHFIRCKFEGGYGAGFGSLNEQEGNAQSIIYFEGCEVSHVNTGVKFDVAMFAERNTGIETMMFGHGNNFVNENVLVDDHNGNVEDHSWRVSLSKTGIQARYDLPTDTATGVAAQIIMQRIDNVSKVFIALAMTNLAVQIPQGADIYNMDVSSAFSFSSIFACFGYSAERMIAGQYAYNRLTVRNCGSAFAAGMTTSIMLEGTVIGGYATVQKPSN